MSGRPTTPQEAADANAQLKTPDPTLTKIAGNTQASSAYSAGTKSVTAPVIATVKTATSNGAVAPNTPSTTANGGSAPSLPASGDPGTATDPAFDQAEKDVAPMSEDQIYAYYAGKSAATLNAINSTASAAELAATNQESRDISAANADNASRGITGNVTSVSTSKAVTDQQEAIANAEAAKNQALATVAQNITAQAAADFKEQQEVVAPNYIALKKNDLNNALSGIVSSGATLDDLKTNHPNEYSTLVQYAGGDPNALNALYVGASQANLLNNGQPLSTIGNTLVYGVKGVDANGNPTIKTTSVSIPDLPPNYKVSSYNQAANGTVTYVAFPTDAAGNQTVDPSKPNNGVVSGVIGGAQSGQTVGGATLGTIPTGVSTTAALTGQGIIDGTTPPNIGSSNSGQGYQTKAYLEANGYDLAKATLDWQAMTKYVATLNSSQQIRLRQAAIAVPDMLTNVKSLYNDLQSKLSLAGETDINSAILTAAQKGIYGPDAQAAAVQLNQQITDITSDLGTIYKGGNSATDQALQTGAEQLQGNWDPSTFDAAVDNINKNIGYRINAINNAGVGGTGTDNQYAASVGDTSGTSVPGTGSSGDIYSF